MAKFDVPSDESSSQYLIDAKSLLKKLTFLEKHREKSYKQWQYKDNENCSIKKVSLIQETYLVPISKSNTNNWLNCSQMAEAGFFWSGDYSATCFVCGKVLDGWESDDDPWQEHEKHAPRCHFVQLHLKQDEMTVTDSMSFNIFN